MENNFDKLLAARIRTLSEAREPEPYEIGAWESFESAKFGSGNYTYKFLWVGLAASFLMAMSVNVIYDTNDFDGIKKSSSFSFHSPEIDYSPVEDNKEVQVQEFQTIQASSSNVSFASSRSIEKAGNFKLVKYGSAGYRSMSGPQGFSFFPEVFASNRSYSEDGKMVKYSSGFIPYNESPQRAERKNRKQNSRQIKVGVVLASSLNSIGLEKSGCNIGAGLLTDIPLLRGLYLNTGLILNAQRIKFESTEMGQNIHTNGKMMSVDLPVNLRYNVCQKHEQQFFVSAGISSLAYVKEKFSDQVSFIEDREISENEKESFSGLDLAKFMNLSMGVEIPLERQFSLLIEPYLKYPLGNSTSREIKYASAGLSVRLNMGLALLN